MSFITMNFNIIGYILIILIIIFSIKIYNESDAFQLKCIISDVDGNKYCVRERNKLTMAADLLANCTIKMKKLVEHMKKTYPNQNNVNRLVTRFNPNQISETLPTSEFTAYSENKGEKLAFCLNTTKNGTKLIDSNTLFFIAMHELAHIMTESIGHQEEFWKNFKFLIENAVDVNLYKPINYKNKPKSYCGIEINDNPFFDE